MEMYLDLLGQHLGNFEQGSELRELAHTELARGDDGVFKALLILLCPRLRTVNFARTSYVPTEEASDVGNTTLAWLCRVATSHRDQNIAAWPPGLRSLRHLNVGIETGTRFDSHIRQIYHPLFMANMLNLPKLESIYLYGLGYEDIYASDEEHDDGYPLTPGCSSVRHIYVEQLENLGLGFWRHVASACKNQVCVCLWRGGKFQSDTSQQLTSVAFHGVESQDIDDYIRASTKEGPNLQSMMCYGSGLTGYQCDLYSPVETLGGYNSNRDLRVLTMSIADLELESRQQRTTCEQDLIDYLIGGLEDPALPEAVEVLVLQGSLELFSTHDDSEQINRVEKAAELLDNALATMISGTEQDKTRNRRRMKSDRASDKASDLDRRPLGGLASALPRQEGSWGLITDSNEPQADNAIEDEAAEDDDVDADATGPYYIYPNLKAIYIEPWQGQATPAAMQSSSSLWFQKSIEAGIKRGVDIRTRTNVNPPKHQNLPFHVAPDRFDLRPDLAPPENHHFDPFQGRWVDRGCQNCGTCENCFALFPKELWAQAYRAEKEEDHSLEVRRDSGYDDTYGEPLTRTSTQTEPDNWQGMSEHAKSSRLCQRFPPTHFPWTARGKAFLLERGS